MSKQKLNKVKERNQKEKIKKKKLTLDPSLPKNYEEQVEINKRVRNYEEQLEINKTVRNVPSSPLEE